MTPQALADSTTLTREPPHVRAAVGMLLLRRAIAEDPRALRGYVHRLAALLEEARADEKAAAEVERAQKRAAKVARAFSEPDVSEGSVRLADLTK